MRATIDDVHHRDWQGAGVHTPNVLIQWHAEVLGASVCGCQAHTQNRVGTQTALVLGAIQFNHGAIKLGLRARIHPSHCFKNLMIDVVDSILHALAAIGVGAITQFHSLKGTR